MWREEEGALKIVLVKQISNRELNQLRKLSWFETDIRTLREIRNLSDAYLFHTISNLVWTKTDGTFIACGTSGACGINKACGTCVGCRAVFMFFKPLFLCRYLFL